MCTNDLAQQIRNKALELGFDGCGIIKLDALKDFAEKLDERIEACPDSKPMLEAIRQYAAPDSTYAWAKSVVVCTTWYGKYKIPEKLRGLIGKYYLYDHKLQPHSKANETITAFEKYLDELEIKTAKELHGVTSARWAAFKAGLGIIRKNNFFYTKHGSWSIIDTWVIDHELEWIEIPDAKPCPENCDKCISACPTKALSKSFCTNPAKCITKLTWGVRDLVPDSLSEKMGGWIYGCDACQDACPSNTWVEDTEYPGLRELEENISLSQILSMDDKDIKEILMPKFWFIQPDNFWIWKVNALRAMTNAFRPEYKEHILKAANDENEKIKEMALWSLKRLGLISHLSPSGKQ